MNPLNEALRVFQERREDAIVLPTMTGGNRWRELNGRETMDHPVSGAMGKASSIALGLCLAQPQRKIIVVDGDGSLLMNLGSLVTIGGKAPENLYHFVMHNGVYAVTGGQPIPNADGFTFAGLAKASGYANSVFFDDLEDFVTSIDEIFASRGPVMIALKSEPVVENTPSRMRTRVARLTPQAMREKKETLSGR